MGDYIKVKSRDGSCR